MILCSKSEPSVFMSGLNSQVPLQPIRQLIRVHAMDSAAHLRRFHMTDRAAHTMHAVTSFSYRRNIHRAAYCS